MSKCLIILVGLIYLAIAIDSLIHKHYANTFVYFGYSFANVGLYMLL